MKITKKHPLPWGAWVERQPAAIHDANKQEITTVRSRQLAEYIVECVNSTICEKCGGDGTVTCFWCNGSGEGAVDGTRCPWCKGKSVVPCMCQEEGA